MQATTPTGSPAPTVFARTPHTTELSKACVAAGADSGTGVRAPAALEAAAAVAPLQVQAPTDPFEVLSGSSTGRHQAQHLGIWHPHPPYLCNTPQPHLTSCLVPRQSSAILPHHPTKFTWPFGNPEHGCDAAGARGGGHPLPHTARGGSPTAHKPASGNPFGAAVNLHATAAPLPEDMFTTSPLSGLMGFAAGPKQQASLPNAGD